MKVQETYTELRIAKEIRDSLRSKIDSIHVSKYSIDMFNVYLAYGFGNLEVFKDYKDYENKWEEDHKIGRQGLCDRLGNIIDIIDRLEKELIDHVLNKYSQ